MTKQFEELDFSDWFIFGRVLEDPALCRDFLSTLLQEDIGPLTTIVREKDLRITVGGKTVRLDICASRKDIAIYDAEMQNLPANKTVRSLQLPLRSRAYQSMLDSDVLDRGAKFEDLPDVNIVFICTFDPFDKGKYLYHFVNTCTDDSDLKLQDRAHRFFFNVTSEDPDIPDGIRKLFDYIKNRKPADELTMRIDSAVHKARRIIRERSQYIEMIFPDDIIDDIKGRAWAAGREEGMEAGREEGREEGRKSFIEDALSRGKTCEEIADFFGIPLEQVKEIEKNMG